MSTLSGDVYVERALYDPTVWMIYRGTAKVGHIAQVGRRWHCNAWVEGALLQWEREGTKAEAVAAVVRSYQPWTLAGAYAKLATAEEHLATTREPLGRLTEAARAATADLDAANRDYCDAMARVASLQRTIIDAMKEDS